MELYQLRGFAAVAEQGHLTRAADKLHVSQPALSAQIKALEDELGVELFERRSDGMGLTPAGRQLLASAREVIDAASALRAKASALGGEVQGTLRVGTLADPAFVRLPEVLLGAAERYPLLDIAITHQVTSEVFAQVRDGTLDASFYFGDAQDATVGSMQLRNFGLAVVAPAAWRERVEGATFADLAALPWILTPPATSLRTLCDALFARHGVSPDARVSADNEEVLRALVVAGVGVSLVREDHARALSAEGSVVIWEGERLRSALRFVWNRRREGEPALRALIGLVRAAWAQRAEGREPLAGTAGSRVARRRTRQR
jgi:DNA-binding transcriptional LysR family regulator